MEDSFQQTGAFHTKQVRPTWDALQEMGHNNEKETLQVVEMLARRINQLAQGKYKEEGQFAFGRAASEVYQTSLSDGDKKHLAGALEHEVQRQKEKTGGSRLQMNPEVVFRGFMAAFTDTKKR